MLRKGGRYGRLLRKVQGEERDEECRAGDAEERQEGDEGQMPYLRHGNVQDFGQVIIR